MSYPILRANEHWDRSSKAKFKRQDMKSDMFGPLNQDPALGRDEFYFRFARPKIAVVTVSGHLARKIRRCDISDEAKLGFRAVLYAREYSHKRAEDEGGGDVRVSPGNIGEYASLQSNGTCTLYKLPPLEARFEIAEDGEGRCRGITYTRIARTCVYVDLGEAIKGDREHTTPALRLVRAHPINPNGYKLSSELEEEALDKKPLMAAMVHLLRMIAAGEDFTDPNEKGRKLQVYTIGPGVQSTPCVWTSRDGHFTPDADLWVRDAPKEAMVDLEACQT